MSRAEIADRVAALYERRPLREYARWKLSSDPAYQAVLELVRDREQPLADVGCGVGLLPLFLRESGYRAPITGIDFDERKIDAARAAAQGHLDVELIVRDAREPLPPRPIIVLLDVLHYFDPASQQRILDGAARAVPPGGIVILRQGLRDGSWRYRLTSLVDALARVFRWMKAEDLVYPTREEIAAAFVGFESDIRPLRGRMPFNNYLLVFRRPATDRRSE